MMAKVWDKESLLNLFRILAEIMTDKRDMLITLDSEIGDGDLGITMHKAFTAVYDHLQLTEEFIPGKICIEAGKVMAKNAPSTMGTLMATGFMYGGKALAEAEVITGDSLRVFFEGFLSGVVKRGKAKPGEKTLVDVLEPVVSVLQLKQESDLSLALVYASEASSKGLVATKNMVSQHGKAAIYREQTLGKIDPGATAMNLVIQGFLAAL